MVPNGWFTLKLDEIVKKTQLGSTERHKGDSCQSSIPLLKMGNLNWGGFNLTSLELLPLSKVEKTLLLNKGDFLFNTRNTPQLVGKSAVWNGELEKATFDNNINKITFHDDRADSFYMGYYLNTGIGKSKIRSLSAGSTSVAAIYWKDLKNIRIELPPIEEQRKIAKILSTWDKAINTTERLIDNSKQQKKALMQQLLTGKKRLLDDSGKPFEGEWEEVKLSHFFERVMEKNNGQSKNVVTISAQHGLIRQEEFFKKSVASETLDNYFILRKGQFAYNKSYSNGYPMGAIKRLNRYDDAVVTSLYICFELKDEQLASGCFMEQFFESGLLNRGLTKVAAEGGRAHGLLNVKPADFMALSMAVPKINEQQKIASVLTNADQEIELLEQQLADLKQEKKALMQQLLTGKRRVKVDDKEVA